MAETAGAPLNAQEVPSPEEVLAALTGLLGLNFLKEDFEKPLQKNSPHDWSLIPWEPSSTNPAVTSEEDNEIPYVNFSSFPSLSLEKRSEGEQLDPDNASFGNREDVEAHVSSLLSRPILVSNANSNEVNEVEDEDAQEEFFMAAEIDKVPNMMMQNFFDSFSTLLNSRLRAHATFLARHGLSLLKTSVENNDNELEEGIVGVEQKLETMLEIGRLVSTNAIATSFQAKAENATAVPQQEDGEESISKVSIPLTMDVSIDISLPRPGGGPSKVVTVSFHTTGSITGKSIGSEAMLLVITSLLRASLTGFWSSFRHFSLGIFASSNGASLLRAVEVDLNMAEILPCMIKQASSVISCIVAMTNAMYSLALPAAFDQVAGSAPVSPVADEIPLDDAAVARKVATLIEQDIAVVSPSLQPKARKSTKRDSPSIPELNLKNNKSLDDEDEASLLSPESCESLVDYVLHDSVKVLGPPKAKRAKVDNITLGENEIA